MLKQWEKKKIENVFEVKTITQEAEFAPLESTEEIKPEVQEEEADPTYMSETRHLDETEKLAANEVKQIEVFINLGKELVFAS